MIIKKSMDEEPLAEFATLFFRKKLLSLKAKT